MLHAGLELSRRKVDVCLLSDEGEHLDQLAVPPDVDSLKTLARRIEEVHRRARLRRGRVDDRRPAGPRHARTAGLGRSRSPTRRRSRAWRRWPARPTGSTRWSSRCSVTETWCRRSGSRILRVREERELARFRLHLVKHRSMLKQRIHSTLINFGRPCPVSDLFGVEGRKLLERLEVPEPWRGNVAASLKLIDDLGDQIDQVNRRLKASHAEHPYVPLLMSAPGIGWVLAFTIAAEIGQIERFASPEKLTGYTGLCPRVVQSGDSDRRGPLTKHGPTYLRWALLEATMHALRHPAYPPAINETSAGSASSAGRRSPRSTSPADSPTRSGTCSLATRSSLLEAPLFVWRPDRPFGIASASEHPISPDPPPRRP